jgi:diacylglycerol kinase family enzyme
MTNRILIFANPIAGRGRGGTLARRLLTRLRAERYDVILHTERPETFDRRLLDPPPRAAIVIGGDGTLRAVAEHLFLGLNTPDEMQGSEVPLLIIPLGTANLMVRHLGIRWDDPQLEDDVSDAITRRRVIRLDTARANGRLFLLMAGIGFDAHVVHELDRTRRGPLMGYVSYALPAALAVQGYTYPPISVTVDSRVVFPAKPAVAFVGNVAEYGTGFPLLPQARPDDGLLDVCVLPCRSKLDLVRLFMDAVVGEHMMTEGAVYTKGRHIRIETPGSEPVPVQVDGDSAGYTPVQIDLLPLRVPFLIP